ncbi:MAG TPA: GNAT family N-acetyltransferase [Meiothermus sp.]|nr:GNAT family N-acetyltransferase [Meiothermus sp.]
MDLHIRTATPDDFAEIVAIIRQHEPDSSATVESMKRADAHLEPPYLRQRFVALQDGKIVGYSLYSHSIELYHPRKFFVYAHVDRCRQGQGIGSALYEHLMTALKPQHPQVLWTDTSEAWPQAQQFLRGKGFTETTRAWESTINPQTFDPTPYAEAEARVLAQGFRILNWDQLVFDPERNQKYWRLEMALSADMPRPEGSEFTEYSYANFVKRFLEDPNFIPPANLIALAPDGRYVGLNAIWKDEASGQLNNGTTGTLPEFKRRGIALALKVKNLLWAKEHGYTCIRTFNRSDNLPMWSLNERLGFVRKPAWVSFEKRL